MKYINKWGIVKNIFMLCMLVFLLSCEKENIIEPEVTEHEEDNSSDSNKEGNEPTFYCITKDSMNGRGTFCDDYSVKDLYGQYSYVFEFGFGVDENAYRYGITKVVAHLSIDSGYFRMGKQKSYYDIQLDITGPKETNFWNYIFAVSPKDVVTISYSFDYYRNGVKHSLSTPDSYTIIAK